VSQVSELVALQAVDDEAAALQAALADVERQLRGNPELDSARRELASAEAELAEVLRQQRRIDGEIEGLTARIEPEEKRLYDGSVKNPKELGNIQHEIDLLKERRSHFEDELLDVLARLEVAERSRAAAAKSVAKLEAGWEHQQQELRHEVRRLSDSLALTERRRAVQQGKVGARSLSVYEAVRKKRGGGAVARIQGGACGGCRITIPDALRRRAFSSELLAQCPNCERILYIG
jgi:predicted  nucleic acid-binding Zn-ribbon protein